MDAAPDPRPYHHGDLRPALLASAEIELAEHGSETFSLRAVARRAGVSHAAPAHHFRDTAGLLTALAAEGFRRFVDTQKARQAAASPAPLDQLLAAGLGYVDFALEHPAIFRLMFASARPDFADPALAAASEAAFAHLTAGIAAVSGALPADDPAVMADATAAWAIAHGLADLLQAGRLKVLGQLPPAARDAALAGIIARFLPSPS